MSTVNRHKILNDPVYGFVTLRHERALDLMDHRYMQRLRRISQLGLSHLVYPGAVHNRFHHAMGCMHLMQEAIDSLRKQKREEAFTKWRNHAEGVGTAFIEEAQRSASELKDQVEKEMVLLMEET